MGISKVIYGGRTLIDLTSDTVSPASLLLGETAHDASGELIVGTASGGSSVSWSQAQLNGQKIAEITINGTTQNVYSPELDISKQAYEALTEQEQKNGTTYYVFDDNGVSGISDVMVNGRSVVNNNGVAVITIPSVPRPDWDQTDSTADDYIRNKISAKAVDGQTIIANSISTHDVQRSYTAMVEGYRNTLYDASTCHVEGTNNNLYKCYDTHVEGSTQTLGDSVNDISGGDDNHVEGLQNTIKAIHRSHIEGSSNTSSFAEEIHMEGSSNVVNGVSISNRVSRSHVEGGHNTISASYAHGEGSYVTVNGRYAHGGGHGSVADGENSFVHGDGAKASNINQVSFGSFNSEVLSTDTPAAYTIFAVGNGSNNNNRSNVFEIRSNGVGYLNNEKLITDAKVPDAPVSDGTYVLKVTVANGVPTYAWVLET